MSTLEDAGDDDGNTSDQLRIEVWDALSGAVAQTVLVSTQRSPVYWLAPSLSTDHYVALLDTVLPDPGKGPHMVQIVDLAAGELLDLELTLGDVP